MFWEALEKESWAGELPGQSFQEPGVSNSVLGSNPLEVIAFCPGKPRSFALSETAEKTKMQEITAHTGGPGTLRAQKDGWDPAELSGPGLGQGLAHVHTPELPGNRTQAWQRRPASELSLQGQSSTRLLTVVSTSAKECEKQKRSEL